MKIPRRIQRQLFNLVFALIFLAISYAIAKPGVVLQVPGVSTPGLYRVDQVLDGDTISVDMNGTLETVRFIGVDTPETHDPRKPVQCFGQVASAWTKERLTDKAVRLEADPTNNDRDKYSRLLRYVYLPDGTLMNAELIRQGYGFAYTIFPFEKLAEFRTLEREARETNRGLWAGCNIDESSEVKQTTGNK
jgi:micrococcal nuclease